MKSCCWWKCLWYWFASTVSTSEGESEQDNEIFKIDMSIHQTQHLLKAEICI
jgi:hypothetical protein